MFKLTARYEPQEWSQPWNLEGTPIGETCDMGVVSPGLEAWVEDLLPGQYTLHTEEGDHFATLVIEP